MIGATIGNYRILKELDRGGMGVVYVAEHVTMGKRAVVKQLLADFTTNPQIVARFLNEAKAAAAIDDPSIVQVFDQGTLPDGSAFIAMELLQGESLAARLERERALPADLVVTLTRQTCRGMAAAHQRGIIHRDLKPQNLFLCPDPEVAGGLRVKILDFGIAKLRTDPGASQTQTGLPMGTPHYMPPELWRSAGRADGRTDVYALGCVLYQMLTGRPPFAGPDLPDFMDQHRFMQPPSPSAIDARLAPFDLVIQRALAKNPDDRFPSMHELAVALPAGDAGRDHAPGRSRAPLYAVAGMAAATAVALTFLIVRSSSSSTAESTKTPTARPVSPHAPPVLNRWIAIAPASSPPLLGVAEDGLPESVTGFRPRRNVRAPAYAYELQQHEVTFEELEPWLAKTGQSFELPRWVPTDPAVRRKLPAVGVPWQLAKLYCQSDEIGGNLPTEGEWEYAARGAARRPYPWGDDPVDLARTHAGGDPQAVMTSDQDRTPSGIADLLGNAQEWTLELYRMDDAGADESWVQANGLTFRTIRGLPRSTSAETIAAEGAAYREPFCATGPCPAKGRDLIETIGFRCARRL